MTQVKPEACWTCRRRTIQCDRSGTPCAKCKKAGLECFEKRPLRWVTGLAIRGKMRGRAFDNDRKVSTKHISAESNHMRSTYSQRMALAANLNIHPSFALEDPQMKNIDASSKFYLDYFNVRVCKLFILYDGTKNPFRHLLTYAMNDILLQRCILAVSARHFANIGQPFDRHDTDLLPRFVVANIDALNFKRQTVGRLTQGLKEQKNFDNITLMATILLLIFLDLLESGLDGWNYHLRGAKGLANLCSPMQRPVTGQKRREDQNLEYGTTERDLMNFIAEQFSLISALGEALSGSETRVNSYPSHDAGIKHESIVRSFLGCPEFLLRAVRYFSSQRDFLDGDHDKKSDSAHDHMSDTSAMLDMTRTFDCQQWASRVLHLPSFEVESQKLLLLAKAYKIATILYGMRVLRAFASSTETKGEEDQDLVFELITTVKCLESDDAFFKCLIWPTFIAGLECKTMSGRVAVDEHLRKLWDLTSCVNVINASRILQDHWIKQDSSPCPNKASDELEIISQGWLLI